MPRPSPPRIPPGRRGGRGLGPRGGHRHVALLTMGLAIYLASLWLGGVVIGDSLVRSALMAGLIVSIAVAGYVFTRGSASPND
jgi:hypothetical protein